MLVTPERYLGAFCVVSIATSAMLATIEWWHGFRYETRDEPGEEVSRDRKNDGPASP